MSRTERVAVIGVGLLGRGIATVSARAEFPEILYGLLERNEGQIMIAPYSVKGDEFIVEKPRPWLGQRYQGRGPNRMFDLHPDGTRVALGPVIGPENRPHYDQLTMVFNLFDMLHRIVKP
jgi:hypothetical protein